MWILYAAGSAFFAGVTSILAKCGIRKTDSDIATAVRTVVVPIDKSSTVLTIVLAFIFLHEGVTLMKAATALILAGTILMIEKKDVKKDDGSSASS